MLFANPHLFSKHSKKIRILYSITIIVSLIVTILFLAILYTKQIAFELLWYQIPESSNENGAYTVQPFPVGVYPAEKRITPLPNVEFFLGEKVALNKPKKQTDTIIQYVLAKLTQLNWYQNLASPSARILVIHPGARKEEVANNFSKILKWDQQSKEIFLNLVTESAPVLSDGKFYPAQYLVNKDATPQEVADIVIQRFNAEIATRYTQEIDELVPFQDAMIIASLLEREAYDFTDMREISGIIWNRLFIGMNLQIDATLQYAKGTNAPTTWYPPVRPDDKYINSEFNTYANKGLPPFPIGSPSAAAVLAALNPIKTDCLFYFHDKNSKFFCAPTYEEHVRLLKQSYGRGK